MAAWGSLLNIFENPVMSDSLSSWSQLLPSKADVDTAASSSSFDVFGDLCHHVNPDPPSPVWTPPRFDKPFSWNNTRALSEPPPDDAFEIFGELFYKSKPEDDDEAAAAYDGDGESSITEEKKSRVPASYYRRSYSDVRPRSRDGGLMILPPPITSIGEGGKPRVYFESFRKDGRFVLREMRVPTQQLLHSTRENGRLRMRVAADDPPNNILLPLPGEEEEEDPRDGGGLA